MADREDQVEASWDELPLPDQFPEPHTEGSNGARLGEVGGSPTTGDAGGRPRDHPPPLSPNLLQMLKAAEGRRTHHGRDGEVGEAAGAELAGEAQRTDMVSGVGVGGGRNASRGARRGECTCDLDVNDFPWSVQTSVNL